MITAPALAEALEEARHAGKGFSLSEVSAVVAAIERLVLDETMPMLKGVYALNNQSVADEVDEESLGKNGNVVIHKNWKLALCYFPKVASAEMNSMFNNLNHLTPEDINGHVFGASSPGRMDVDLANVTQENGWKFGFITRDPLNRFLSAFGSKCLPKEDGSPGDVRYCGGIVGQTEKDGWQIIDHPVEEEEAVQAFEKHVLHFKEALYTEEEELDTDNKHYMRMVDILAQCGDDRFAPEKVDFIGHLNGPVHHQVRDFLMMGQEVNETEIDMFVDKFFPAGDVHGHSSTTHMEAGTFYRNHTIAAMVHKMYEPDYEILGKAYDGDRLYYEGPRP